MLSTALVKSYYFLHLKIVDFHCVKIEAGEKCVAFFYA